MHTVLPYRWDAAAVPGGPGCLDFDHRQVTHGTTRSILYSFFSCWYLLWLYMDCNRGNDVARSTVRTRATRSLDLLRRYVPLPSECYRAQRILKHYTVHRQQKRLFLSHSSLGDAGGCVELFLESNSDEIAGRGGICSDSPIGCVLELDTPTLQY